MDDDRVAELREDAKYDGVELCPDCGEPLFPSKDRGILFECRNKDCPLEVSGRG